MTVRAKTAILLTVVLALMVVLAYINAQNVRGNGSSRFSFDATLSVPTAAVTGSIMVPAGDR